MAKIKPSCVAFRRLDQSLLREVIDGVLSFHVHEPISDSERNGDAKLLCLLEPIMELRLRMVYFVKKTSNLSGSILPSFQIIFPVAGKTREMSDFCNLLYTSGL
jgi:hypothetical protein